mmetsp:Transcript_24116/g.58670  ORF Transcript_24116/g.58670 Transcript_24116/m.58670 type:complete len:132 (-) Transcript_24116:119-514(-)
MGKNSLSKAELVEILTTTKKTSERNKAVKQLKKFDLVTNKHCDSEARKDNLRMKKLNYLVGFMCWRCGGVRQTNIKCYFNTREGQKTICYTCCRGLLDFIEVEQLRKEHQRQGIVPKVPAAVLEDLVRPLG